MKLPKAVEEKVFLLQEVENFYDKNASNAAGVAATKMAEWLMELVCEGCGQTKGVTIEPRDHVPHEFSPITRAEYEHRKGGETP